MAPGKVAADFNAIINADRQRRKHEALAQEIFSKNRRSSAPGAGTNNRKPGTGPSLASRVGIAKKTAPTSIKPAQKQNSRPAPGNVNAEWTHDLHSSNNTSFTRVSQRGGRRGNRNDRLHSALNGSASSPALNSQFNIISAPRPSAGISIRGLAGPYLVTAKNFAFGTTAADIESAMTPVGGVTLDCRIIAERPNVIAEITFESKEGADSVVDTFNNQNADGNLLHVYHKIGGSKPKPISQPVAIVRSVTPLGPRSDVITDRSDGTRPGYGRYAARDRSRDRQRNYNSRDEVTDGSYGFDDRMDTDDLDNSRGQGGGLYSDNLVGNNRDRGRGNDRGRGYR